MRIGIDIDGVLANFTKGYAGLIREVSGRDLLTDEMIKRPPTWNWDQDAGYTREEEGAALKLIKESPSFWFTLEALPGAAWITDLTDNPDHDVYFITARHGQNVKLQTELWLIDQGVELPTVLISDNKGPLAVGLRLEAIIDDRDKNILEVSAASPETTCYVLDYPYNQDLPVQPNIKRVYSVKEFIDALA